MNNDALLSDLAQANAEKHSAFQISHASKRALPRPSI
jgi:hypothetical protein